VNLREQHDALEFFGKLVDSCDEAMQALGLPQLCSKVLGGSYADQKICKDCPHRSVRYSSFKLLPSISNAHTQRAAKRFLSIFGSLNTNLSERKGYARNAFISMSGICVKAGHSSFHCCIELLL